MRLYLYDHSADVLIVLVSVDNTMELWGRDYVAC